ncbi:hypothetical protein PS627_01675 [Pseudomonas fluorescens]|nr:hypothetical protein PS627_01675 [Pseudomonas fluorescens]VVP88114.1 hypothetical protein PS910_02618 [Pseudomonas fluorescens]
MEDGNTIGQHSEPLHTGLYSKISNHSFVIVDQEVYMSKKPETGHGFSDNPQKVHDAGGKGGSHQDVKTDRAEKARVGGQHSNGGSDRRGGRS